MTISSSSSLTSRVKHAGSWVAIGHGLSQLIRLASNLVMTRLLAPELFGLMAIAWLVMTGLQLLSDVGLRQSIVRSESADAANFRGTAWGLQIVRGVVLWLSGLLIAGIVMVLQRHSVMPIGSVYADPALAPVIGVLSLVALISGFESTRVALAERNLAQRAVVQMEILSLVCGVVCMVCWALIDRSIWALVSGGVVGALVRLALSHLWLPGAKDVLAWDGQVAREMLTFGKWVFLSSALGFAVNSGDRLMLGGMVIPELLGLYAIAFLIVDSVTQVLSKLLGAVSFPALSEIARERPAQLREVYYRFRFMFDGLALFSCGALFMAGERLVMLLFDSRYQSAGHIVEVLAISLFFVRYGVAEMCCLVLNKPQVLSMQVAVRGVALYAGVPLLFSVFGFNGAIWAIALHKAFSLLPVLFFAARNGLLDLKKEIYGLAALPVGLAVGGGFNFLFSII